MHLKDLQIHKYICKCKTDLQIRKIFLQKKKKIFDYLFNIYNFRSGICESILYLSTKNVWISNLGYFRKPRDALLMTTFPHGFQSKSMMVCLMRSFLNEQRNVRCILYQRVD